MQKHVLAFNNLCSFQLVTTVRTQVHKNTSTTYRNCSAIKKGPSFTRSSIWWSMWQRKQLAYLNISFVLENLVPMP